MNDINNMDLDSLVDDIMNESTQTEETVQQETIEEPTLPRFALNPTYVEATTSRFTSADWYTKMRKTAVCLIGLGGIGSYVAFLLSRLKPSIITYYDPDNVEEVNLSGQLYGLSDIGTSKCSAITRLVRNYSDYYAGWAQPIAFSRGCSVEDIVICGLDNMTARKTAFHAWRNHLNSENYKNCLFIDGRLAAEEFQVFCMTGNDEYLMNKYNEEWLFSDEEAEETVCSYKQTSFCANMIASVMINLLVNFITNLCDPIIERELPFKTTYDASTMNFKIE